MLWTEIGQEWQTAWTAIKTFFTTWFAEMKTEFLTGWNAIKTAMTTNNAALESETKAVWARIKTAIAQNNRAIEAETKAAWNAIKSALSAAWNAIVNAIRTRINQTIALVKTLPSKLKGVFSGAAGWLLSAGKAIMQGLIKGIEWGISKVESLLSGLTSKIPSWKGPPATDRALLRDNGQLIIEGLIGGMQSRERGVESTLRSLTRTIGAGTPGIGGSFSAGGVASDPAAAIDPDAFGRSVARHLIGGTFRIDSRGDLQLIAAGG